MQVAIDARDLCCYRSRTCFVRKRPTPRKDAMEYVDCPECRGPAKRMPVLSHINRTDDFYQCESCSLVSCMPKDASAPPVRFHMSTVRAREATSA